MECTQLFQRHEKKYLLCEKDMHQLLQSMAGYIREDEFGRYTICSLYYDTADFACFFAGKRRPHFKEKLRLRSYGVPAAGDTVYLELKKKYDSVTFKRRAPLSLREAQVYMEAGLLPAECDSQTMGEISWFKNRYALQPKTVLSYDRTAFAGVEEEGLRITFDTRVRFRDEALYLEAGDWGEPLLPHGSVLMEIKAPHALPLWLAQRLSAVGAFPSHFSKYNHVAARLLQTREKERHAG